MNFKCLFKRQKGAAMVEMAIALPLFLLIIFGIMQFGWLLNNYVLLNNAAMLGARTLAKERGNPKKQPRTRTINTIQAAIPTLNQQNITITTYIGLPPNTTACTTDSNCDTKLGTSTTLIPNTQVKVSVSYAFSPLFSGFTAYPFSSLAVLSQLNASASEFAQ